VKYHFKRWDDHILGIVDLNLVPGPFKTSSKSEKPSENKENTPQKK